MDWEGETMARTRAKKTTTVIDVAVEETVTVDDYGPLDELSTFHALVKELDFDPDAELNIPMDVHAMVHRLTGATSTTFTREQAEKVRELLDGPEAAREWFRQKQLLEIPEQIALPPAPVHEETSE